MNKIEFLQTPLTTHGNNTLLNFTRKLDNCDFCAFKIAGTWDFLCLWLLYQYSELHCRKCWLSPFVECNKKREKNQAGEFYALKTIMSTTFSHTRHLNQHSLTALILLKKEPNWKKLVFMCVNKRNKNDKNDKKFVDLWLFAKKIQSTFFK